MIMNKWLKVSTWCHLTLQHLQVRQELPLLRQPLEQPETELCALCFPLVSSPWTHRQHWTFSSLGPGLHCQRWRNPQHRKPEQYNIFYRCQYYYLVLSDLSFLLTVTVRDIHGANVNLPLGCRWLTRRCLGFNLLSTQVNSRFCLPAIVCSTNPSQF